MGLNIAALLRLCCSSSSVANGGRNNNNNNNGPGWFTLGRALLEMAGPYLVQFIGEVDRPDPVNIGQAFQDAANAQGFKPYEAPKYGRGTVRAVLIGINYYGSKAELSGCVNDVRQELATFEKTKFPIDEMVILVDEKGFPNNTAQPTRANIIKYMAWLVKDRKKGDVCFLHYSGHGSQTKSNDEYEEYDQVLCPVDYTKAGCIVDNDIFAILAKDMKAGVRLTVLFDCCHSGSMLDLPYTFVGGSGITSKNNYHMKQIRKDNFSAGDVLMISGCADNQTSADVRNTASMGNGTSGAGGAATQCLTYTLLNGENLSYKDTMVETRDMLKKKKFEQVPQLSASKPLDLNQRFSLVQLFKLDSSMSSTLPAMFR